jgi:hypothetical protein
MQKLSLRTGSIRLLLVLLVPATVVGGCGDSLAGRNDPGSRRLLVLDAPPAIIVSAAGAGRREAALLAEIVDNPSGGTGRRVEASSAAFLYNTGWGRAFLAAPDGRALAMGDPPEQCPGIGVVAGGPETPHLRVAEAAIEQCLQSLDRAGATGCGCRLLALDDTLLAPLEAFAHAPGVGARLIGLGGGVGSQPLVARESREMAADGSVRVLFSTVAGPVAAAALFPDGRAVLEVAESGVVLEGARDLRGWRRGRLTERLLLEGPDGQRVIALIGFEPEDYAREGLALARWPRAKG